MTYSSLSALVCRISRLGEDGRQSEVGVNGASFASAVPEKTPSSFVSVVKAAW